MSERTEQKKLSIGEERVRISFNPSGSGDVYSVKSEAAISINRCESAKPLSPCSFNDAEVLRLLVLAQTAYEEAAMWMVKALTYNI